jgi:hypothetical protein
MVSFTKLAKEKFARVLEKLSDLFGVNLDVFVEQC